MTLCELMDRHFMWTQEMFPDVTIDQKLIHAQKELVELRLNPKDLHEYADVLFLVINAAMKSGYTLLDLQRGLEEKFIICKNRKSWHKTATGDYQHDL